MPRKKLLLPPRESCKRIRQLLSNHLPLVFEPSEVKVLAELFEIDSGIFHERIEHYRSVGRRAFDRQAIGALLAEKQVEYEHMCRDLNVNITTIGRYFKGESATELTERIFDRYHKELVGFQRPAIEDVYFAGYRYAVIQAREVILSALDEFTPPRPGLGTEEFCFLWHLIQSRQWQLALRSEDEPSLDAAAANVAERVCRDLPKYECSNQKSASDLMTLHEVWGLWLRLVVFCEHHDDAKAFDTE